MNRIFLIIAGACVSIACLTYVWNSYNRYQLEAEAQKRCAVYIDEYSNKVYNDSEKAGIWLANRQCVTKAVQGVASSD